MRKLSALIIISAVIYTWLSININPDKVTVIYGSPAFYDRNGILFHVRLSPASEWHIPIPLSEMGKWLPLVAVNAEDGRFYSHFGVDVIALMRAVFQDVTKLDTVSGASTITAQLIRLAVSEPERRKRTLSTKFREFIMAVKLERYLTKSQILEAYLNLAPFGGNIRGVQAASLIYFGKKADQISPGEACMLIGMLKGPSLYRPDKYPSSAIKRRNQIISLMERKNVFDHNTALRASLEELPRKKFRLPSRAWHFTELLLSQNPEHSQRFDTALDIEIQTKLEGILRASLSEVPNDITFSAGISDNQTGSIIAWAGNARFSFKSDEKSASWVDCGKSLRSPGSTLKPFAYLSAVEKGILTPSTLIYDTPYAFSGRAPRNFDLSYRGGVTARTALSESLNAPAVRVLRMTGKDKILSFMRSLGFNHLTNTAEFYGDSLILGGCEVSLLEELEAYTALASGGVHRKLKLLKDDIQVSERKATDGGCWIISDILRYGRSNFAVKTGTSYGLRDAWCSSWGKDYTVCIWAGNPAGNSWDGLVGAEISLPVAVQVMRNINPGKWFERPETVKRRKVCVISGKPPLKLCPSEKYEYALSGITQSIPCDIHNIPGKTQKEGLTAEGARNTRFRIVSPLDGAKYFNAEYYGKCRVPLRAEGTNGKISWYLDGKYICESTAGTVKMYSLHDGVNILSATDESGRSTSSRVEVHTPGRSSESEKLF